MMKALLEQAEEWLSKQEPTVRKKLKLAMQGVLAIAPPLLLASSELSAANKSLGIVAWALLMLCLWELCLLCSSRIRVRQLEHEKTMRPELPVLDGFDNSALIYLVVHDIYCQSARIANEMGLDSYKVSHSFDKLEAHGFVEKRKNEHSGIFEYSATPRGRSRCVNPSNEQGAPSNRSFS